MTSCDLCSQLAMRQNRLRKVLPLLEMLAGLMGAGAEPWSAALRNHI
ncbi:MAG: hypothetical protein FWD68_09215 [Alphaproteobacteria bacterium]|nr:hypothetical protein [Alphaproteobacteria bacterium]